MKKAFARLFFSLVFLFPLVLFAQSASPVPVVAAPASSSLLSPAFIALIAGIVVSLNSALSAVQVIFAQWSKAEPGWLQSVSSFVLSVAKFLGSNPSV